ncbi:primosomal protein N' [Nonomuraea rhizosphaerae]|uniref:primosomal protein N' n=1 Tax=Nonomuraea rhizosphaerae TaxID=2665663 RepID=UPI001C5E0DB4|nr:primosomal protein N' [Nonomuraea rhizosphaerae]
MTDSDDALLPLDAVRRVEPSKPAKGAPVPAPSLPVARVAVDNPLPHLDRPFDYLVPATMHETAAPGVRVRVRFAGQLVDGYVLERVEESEHTGKLTPLERVVSPERVLTGEIAGLARAVADRYAGTLADVLRLAVPPRHARAEATPAPAAATAASVSGTTASAFGPAATAAAADSACGTGASATITSAPDTSASASGSAETAPAADSSSGTAATVTPATATPVPGPSAAAGPSSAASAPSAFAATSVTSDTSETTPVSASGPASATAGGAVASTPVTSPASAALPVVGAPDGGQGRAAGAAEGAAEQVAEGGPARAAGSGLAQAIEGGPVQAVGDGPEAGVWGDYPMGPSFLDALRNGRTPRAVWSALPGAKGWARAVAEAVRATLDGGRGVVVVVPDGKDVALADAELTRVLTEEATEAHKTGEAHKAGDTHRPHGHVALTADLGPAERYRRWLRVLRGEVRAVVGTRAAVFAPVADLGLVVIWDDGDDLHAERLAPYPHAREVLALRAHRTGAAMLIGGYTRTVEATQLIASRWARPIVAARATIRSLAPRVHPAGEDAELAKDQAARQARLPSLAWRALRQGLESGPVLVQVPRRGYLPALACQHCRVPARCALPPTRLSAASAVPPPPDVQANGTLPVPGLTVGTAQGSRGPARHDQGPMPGDLLLPGAALASCHGPLALRGGHAAPYCRWCGRVDAGWRCAHCGSPRLRAVVVGARRTAEELGRAFPSVPVRTSGRDGVLAKVPGSRALVVATPGAEPVAEGGYAAAVLLDAWALLGRADLRAAEEALRRWTNAAALLRPAAEVVVLADAALPTVQALLRWDPITHAERELAERAELGFPPAVRMATLTGAAAAVRQMLDEVRLPEGAQVLGPVPVDEAGRERAMIRVARGGGTALAAALKGASGVRAARKAADVVRVSVDPLDLI